MQDSGDLNRKMADLLGSLTTGEGSRPSVLPGVNLMRADRYYPPTPVLYEPSIVIIAQGRKTGYLGGQVHRYDPDHYLVLSVPLPFECETEATPDEPMLGVSIRADLSVVTELILGMGRGSGLPAAPLGISSFPLQRRLSEAVVRLLEQLADPEEARLLGPQTVREITYHVLCGEQGHGLREALALHTHFGQISRVIQYIHANFHEALDVGTLAGGANMSPSVFHRRFKEITSTPPLQYLKTLRLHKARMLMVREGFRVGEAAERVGYDSPSQFSREFRRLFGRSPLEEAARVQRMLMSPKPVIAWVE